MKGILLAGGTGSRLAPLTHITNKHLLPVYDRPMLFYPLATLRESGLTDILIVSGRDHLGAVTELLGSGAEHGVRLTYRVQETAGGIAQALALAEDFAAGESVAVILGDNIFGENFAAAAATFTTGAHIFLQKVPDPERFGVATVDAAGRVTRLVEKPAQPESDLAQTGFYLYDAHVFEVIRQLKPSARGELEITDVNNWYLQNSRITATELTSFWSDAGTFESLFAASALVREQRLTKQ